MTLTALAMLAVVVARARPRRPAVLSGGARRPWRLRADRSRRGTGEAPALAHVLSTVTALLHAGLSPAQAWAEALGHGTGNGGVPDVADLLGQDTGRASEAPQAWVARLRGLVGLDSGPDPSRVRRARTVVASTMLAHTLGASLGPVLDRVGDGLAADEESDGDRRAALAAPRSTATLLGWLPLAGPLLGAIVGADPVGVMLGGGAGTVAAILGIGLVVVGRAWVARLVRVARVDRRADPDG